MLQNELEIERATFYKPGERLKTVKPDLYAKLKDIMDSPDFEKMREFRHDITHNHLPGRILDSCQVAILLLSPHASLSRVFLPDDLTLLPEVGSALATIDHADIVSWLPPDFFASGGALSL